MKHPEDNRGPRVPNMLNIETLGEAMRLEKLRGEAFHLSREERDHIAGHALDSIKALAEELAWSIGNKGTARGVASTCSRDVAAISNLLDGIGWEREAVQDPDESTKTATPWHLGEHFPVAQLRPWLEEWQRRDNEALAQAEANLEDELPGSLNVEEEERRLRRAISDAQLSLGTGAILLARIEKWMASHEN